MSAPTRRDVLCTASALALAACAGPPSGEAAPSPRRAEPLPLHAVRLKPSIFKDAIEANRRYLLSLDPERLLHNFHKSAGLPTKGALYGGWEARGIAGHTLGHYLSACSLMHAQTDDEAVRTRVDHIVRELASCQQAHGDGYIGGTTVERDGRVVDGKIIFEEVRTGDIRAGPFDVNGGWVPLYAWHKVHAGLIDAYRLCANTLALEVMLGMADYLATILEGLDDAQMQALLVAEHGGLNESYAETYAATGEGRWLALARRIRDRAVLDPLSEGRNILSGLHANTQIPKVIGLASLHDLTGEKHFADTAAYFHDIVVNHHSYVIGGNSEWEFFRPPDVIAGALSDRTCESCNSYNMLKLTRRLFGWSPDTRLFDYYERTHLNHIMAHQRPDDGMFAYFMPLSSGARRTWSTPEESFWCCVGSGMESHAKHGDSIYWRAGADTLFINLFIPSEAAWVEGRMRLSLETGFPFAEAVVIAVEKAPEEARTLALRMPGWCAAPEIFINNAKAEPEKRENGYALMRRIWRAGDKILLKLPMELRAEAAPDAPETLAFLHGPLVLAADLGPSNAPFEQIPPALPKGGGMRSLTPLDDMPYTYEMAGAASDSVVLKPFFNLYDRRTAVYFPQLTAAEWTEREAAFAVAQAEKTAIDVRTIDVIHLGEPDSERRHDFRTNHSDVVAFGGKNGRQAWWGVGNYIEFDMAVTPEARFLYAQYWGEEIDKAFDILVDGEKIAHETRPGPPIARFVAKTYPLPEGLFRDRKSAIVRFETKGSDAPVYECRILRE
ncbi:glycoside hydrolase family 127 protein [Amphiplicatus metriothermophilus]|uniref:Glycoside hydrolase family 127 protein n=1 Tax=Amphiplicatus metriothermophilus TaxID=1519374 RepID=A0A239PZR1_9PROT|nr:glycoside hydrolase family 127 protein [Amphiplicatus metriothermophilus]MBB5519805.1 hypothetical protein [Amphiplicatus metriothermophilus]SNT75157.1 hypothetical protein SAMN06297382_2586 [Amphiplicatus metriothermophilus]